MKIFDTKSGRKEDFVPLEAGKIKIYVCGPTVYDKGHLGHGRSAVNFDVIRRYFIYKGYEVFYVSNYTDIDDKMINRAREEDISVKELANKIIPEYVQDYGALGIMTPDALPKATEHVPEMIELIRRLEEKGLVYVLDDGVYYDVTKFSDYGRLSGQNLGALQMGARVVVKESKRSPHDFVLWKFRKEGEEDFWESPWGDGRPGWHIECSAMTWKHLGETFDIHGGGLDLTFPHHECEVAQSVGVFGEGSFARYWLHNGFINVDNEKMSKSLGNFFTLREIFEKYDPLVVRFMILQTHYRNPVNFSDVLLEQAKAGLMRIHDFVKRIDMIDLDNGDVSDGFRLLIDDIQKKIGDFMDDDFDTSGALGVLFDLIKEMNFQFDRGAVSAADTAYLMEFLTVLDRVFGVIFYKDEVIGDGDLSMIEEREQARRDKNFKRADEIRGILLKRGVLLEDSATGTVWKRL